MQALNILQSRGKALLSIEITRECLQHVSLPSWLDRDKASRQRGTPLVQIATE